MDRSLLARMESDPLLQTATEWFLEMRSTNVRSERIVEWQEWLGADPAHRQAFERIECYWRIADNVDGRWPTDAEVADDDYTGVESISAWRQRSVARLPDPLRRGLLNWLPSLRAARWIGAVCVLAVGGTLVTAYWPQLTAAMQGGARVAIDTQVGEARTVLLSDGSLVTVGARTSMVVTLLKRSRIVELKRGEAFFGVAKDASRPFIVEVGGTAVTAVGTAFDVRRDDDRLLVAVSEGTVRVAPSGPMGHLPRSDPTSSRYATDNAVKQLVAGEQLSLEAPDGPRITTINTADVGGWREGRLQYLNEPLDLVVADISRYSARRIVISNPQVARIRITGIIFERNIDAWLASLEATFPLHVLREPDGGVRLE